MLRADLQPCVHGSVVHPEHKSYKGPGKLKTKQITIKFQNMGDKEKILKVSKMKKSDFSKVMVEAKRS